MTQRDRGSGQPAVDGFQRVVQPMFVLVAICLGGDRMAQAAVTMHIAVRCHIVAELVTVQDGLQMRSWITEGEVRNIVVPEVNRIGQPAGLRFVLDKVVRARLLNPPDSRPLIDEIAASHRNEDGESDPERIRTLSRTVAHELGHVLGLAHPDKRRQETTDLLMGGDGPGTT